ncbi:MAG: SIMPL domain-containing protein [Patescibacteria group bacterium]|nr:SIMPL domain-containing protein [Patescibacteria group bacterium]
MELFPSSATKDKDARMHLILPPYIPLIMGGAFVIASAIASYAFYSVHALDNVLSVTGSAKKEVTADTVKWTIDITRKVGETNMQSGYPLLAQDLGAIQDFLKQNNVPDSAVTISQVFTEQQYNNNGPVEYNLRQEVTVNSKDVEGLNALAKNISALSAKGIFISNNQLEFYISNLPELRVSLLADAIKDAKARATELAKAGGQSIGVLRSASSGVVQVLPPNSVDVSDYGQYDTQSIQKEVMVTARASFSVR